jgi:lipopolysaccharide transport system ATP-binding protein
MSIIKVENLSKKYIIGHDRNAGGEYRYNSLRDSIAHTVRGMYQRLRHPLSPNLEGTELEDFWALKDINFEIKQGDRVGIIGRNGAGKSTLLKILSRITEPTTGKITLNGRVASLLEVGTGFHPELTGRENIYLNGAVLGMTRIEIKKKFDEIVDFSGVEKFLDTPVKRYSSGMYVRLAFAVAAHLEPEILLVDEVLAVGDAEFQKKCLGKMEDVSKEGRTVIFVSHNMGAINKLCNKSFLIENGQIIEEGGSSHVISSYYSIGNNKAAEVVQYSKKYQCKSNEVRLHEFQVSGRNKAKNVFSMSENIQIKIVYKVFKEISNFHLYMRIYNAEGINIFSSGDWDNMISYEDIKLQPGCYKSLCIIPKNLLNAGEYYITLFGEIPSVRYLFKENNIANFKIANIGGIGGVVSSNRPGVIRPLLKWEIGKLEKADS